MPKYSHGPVTASNKLREPWQKRIKCAKCGDVIYSKYDGQMISCGCGAVAVDQTPHYSRYIGNMPDFIHLDEKEQE